jgi:hypothetical protein
MKKLFFTLLTSITLISFGQAPQQISYQGVARNTTGSVLSNQNIGIKLDLHQGSAAGAVVFSETHTKTTNSFGLFTLGIGSINSGVFTGLNWAAGPYFLEVSIDPAGGTSYTSVGTQQFMSVPYALYAETSGNAGSTPTITINAPNTVTSSAGSYTINIPAITSYTAGPGIDITSGIISNTATAVTPTITGAGSATITSSGNTFTVTTPASTSYSAGTGIDITGGIISNTATAVTPTITGIGSATVISSGNTFTVNTPAATSYSAGAGIDITGGIITNTAVAISPTITSTGIAVVTPTTGNVFNVDVPVPLLNYTPGTSVLSISQGTTVSTATLVGAGTNTIDIVGSGLATVTPTTGSTFTVSVPNPTLTINSGSLSISNGNTIALPEQSLSLNSNSLTISGSGGNTVVLPSASTTTLTQGNNINLTGTAPNYTVSAVTPTITGVGSTTVSGSYPSYTITSAPSSSTSISSGTNIIVSGAYPNYTVSTTTPSLIVVGGTLSGSYPTQTLTIPTQTTPSISGDVLGSINTSTVVRLQGVPVSTIAPTANQMLKLIGGVWTPTTAVQTASYVSQGVASVINAAPLYTINVPMSTYNNNTGVFSTGAFTIAVTPTLSLAGNVLRSGPTTNTVSLPTPTVVSGNSNITVTPSGNTYSVSAVTPTLSVTGGTLTGTYPTQTLTIPTSSTTVISPSTNISVAGTAPNYTISSVTPTLSVIGGALSGSYPTQTLTIPTSSTTVITPSTNIIVAGTAPNYTLSSVTPTLTGTAGITVSGLYPNQTISSTQGLSIASNSIITLTPAGGNITITPAALTYTPATNVLRLTDGLAINTHTLNNYTQGTGISVTGTAPNFTISNTSPAVTPTITGTGVATVNNVSPNYTVNVPMSTYNNNTGVFTTGTQTILVTPTLTLSGTTLQSGSTTNTVNLSSINNWSVTSGVIYPSTLTNSVGVGINNSLGGRLGVSHTSSPASPHINILSPTISDFGRVKFSNTGSSRYFSFEARNNTGGVADAFNIAHNNGTNERQVFLINGDRNVFINNLNLPLTTFHVMTSTATAQGGIASEGFGQSGQLNLTRNNNAGAGPRTQVLINEELGKLNFAGHDGSNYGDGAKIYAKTTENVTTGTRGTELIFAAVPTGTNSNKDAFKINGTGNLEVISGLRIPLGAVAGHVLTSDATGNASWQPGAGLSPWIQGTGIVTQSVTTDKVGIGTNAPQSPLHIMSGPSAEQLRLGNFNQPTYEWIWNVDGTSHLSLVNENNGTAKTYMFMNVNNGNLGLGTSNPLGSLHLVNNLAGNVGAFVDMSATTNTDGVRVLQAGTGNGIFSGIYNASSPAKAIEAQSGGVGVTLGAANSGTGGAGDFQIINAASNAIALTASSNGGGTVVYATNTNSTNTAAVIQANSNSSGVAIYGANNNGATSQFDNFSSSAAMNAINYNTGNAINATASSGRAINASSSGSTTPTANFSNSNSGDVIMSFAGTGRAIYAQTGANGMATSELTNTGTGPVIFAYKNAGTTGGVVANYANNSNTNPADVVLSYNNGVGAAVHAANNPSNLSSALSLWVENGHIKATGTNATSSTTVTSISTSTVIGNDVVGKISITTVATAIPANQEMIRVQFAKSYPAGVTPNIIITPSNANAAGVQGYVSTVSNTGFSLFFNVATAAIIRTYTFNYMVIE